MAKPRVTATDRLSNVIEVVELGRRTGLLSVERDAGMALEEGAIFFISGRAIYGALAGLRGREALAVLARWGDCRFAFDPYAPRPTPNVSGVLPSLEMTGDPRRGARSSPGAQSSPGVWSSPGAPPTGTPAAPSNGASGGAWRSPSAPENSGGYGGPPRNGYGQRNTGPGLDAPGPANPAGYGSAYGSGYGGGDASTAGGNRLLLRRPRRAPDVHDLLTIVATYNLSRSHRTILLLADGEHTLLDLARLSSKSVEEVSQLLVELEAYGLVYYYE